MPGDARTRARARARRDKTSKTSETDETDERRQEQIDETGIIFEKSARPTDRMYGRVFGVP